MKKYVLDLQEDKIRNGKKEYITQTQKKYFKYAIDWCLKTNWSCCKIKNTFFYFDFDKLEVEITSIGYNNIHKYKIKEVI